MGAFLVAGCGHSSDNASTEPPARGARYQYRDESGRSPPSQRSQPRPACLQRLLPHHPRGLGPPVTPKPATKYPMATSPFRARKASLKAPMPQYAEPVDVRGYAPGTLVRCPYTNKIFVVPQD